jgi:hypothetical protein
MPRRQRRYEPRKVPELIRAVHLPFDALQGNEVIGLNFFERSKQMMEVFLGPLEPEKPPNDPLTAWATLAHIGGIEEGGHRFKPELDREQRLALAAKALNEAELLYVESIAVPKRYRTLSVDALVEMIWTAPDYLDRMWAGCWLTLIGWVESPEDTFRSMDEMPPRHCGEMEETIVDAHARSIGVTSQDDKLGWERIDRGYEANMVSQRLTICGCHYDMNGPPSYEQTCATLPEKAGWKMVRQLIPDPPPSRAESLAATARLL